MSDTTGLLQQILARLDDIDSKLDSVESEVSSLQSGIESELDLYFEKVEALFRILGAELVYGDEKSKPDAPPDDEPPRAA